MSTHPSSPSLFSWNLVRPALLASFTKLDPRALWRNPVLFVTFIGALVASASLATAIAGAVIGVVVVDAGVAPLHLGGAHRRRRGRAAQGGGGCGRRRERGRRDTGAEAQDEQAAAKARFVGLRHHRLFHPGWNRAG